MITKRVFVLPVSQHMDDAQAIMVIFFFLTSPLNHVHLLFNKPGNEQIEKRKKPFPRGAANCMQN